ncbi:unnamed protein product [Parajaminaea phylloscopi]
MSGADPRYYQLWGSRPSASSSSAHAAYASAAASASGSSSSTQPYRVDLNVPGGITYAPSDETAAHGIKRRLFLPRRGAIDDEYDFGLGAARATSNPTNKRENGQTDGKAFVRDSAAAAFVVGETDEDGSQDPAQSSPPDAASTTESLGQLALSPDEDAVKSAAQEYADAVKQGSNDESKDRPSSIEKPSAPLPSEAAPSVAPSDARSVRSTMTAADLARSRGLLAKNPRLDGSANVVAFKPPPSISGDTYRSVDPWNAPALRGRSEFDRLTEEERDRGLTKAEEFGGEGNVPSRDEVAQNAERDALANDDGDAATIRTKTTMRPLDQESSALRIADIFIPDPRPNRPLRLVRRTDPTQVLVVCVGVVMTSQELTAAKALQAAAQQGIVDYKTEQAKDLLAQFGGDESGDVRAGLGVYFCPPTTFGGHRVNEGSDSDPSPRTEANFSRRMERVTFPYSLSPQRAALRTVLAALEYLPFPQEGFNKVVVAVEHEWLVRGISSDIHEWRRNDWRLVRSSRGLGHVGETVADRDLWETLDAVVSKWEEVDVNIRFWCPPSNEDLLKATRALAREGACKDNQQPDMVRWVKKRSL